MKFGIGQPVTRVEDQRFLTGSGQYADDVAVAGQAYACFVRSPVAHGDIRRVDAAAARAVPGVLAVYAVADTDADQLGGVPAVMRTKNRDGSRNYAPEWPLLARGRVRFVGQLVAMVVAETAAAAREGADAAVVEFDTLPSVSEGAAAVAEGAPVLWPDAPGNQCFDWADGDETAVSEAFARAARRISLDLVNNRVAPNALETRSAIGEYDASRAHYMLTTTTQGSHFIRAQLAKAIFKVDESAVTVVTRDVGGGFGAKIFVYPEYALVLWAAKKLGRPVRWTSERGEAFLSDVHGRDHVTRGELALDADGRILALRADTIANLGAYLSNYAAFIPGDAARGMFSGVYAIPAAFIRIRGVFTNTVPIDAYRGAGRPEASYLIERLVDVAARETGLGPTEFRRRNFVPATAMPYTNVFGRVYDSGDFARIMADALRNADWDGFEARRQASAARGLRRGRGLSYYIEVCAGGGSETARVRINADGSATMWVGTQSNGQGHATSYAQVAAERLGIPVERIELRQGDTREIPTGGGTGGSRSMMIGGTAVANAAEDVVEKGRAQAEKLLETAAADIEFRDGFYAVVGTDRRVSLGEVAADAGLAGGGLEGAGDFKPQAPTFPNGCHVCEVEIDPATGAVGIVRYTVVDDVGRVVNPLLLAGQVYGGIAQGIGQALLEHARFDPESGQLLTGSYMDYAMPRADDFPAIAFSTEEILCRTNPFGIKGAGEAGTIGAPAALINAIVDALGGRHVDMPATPERVWRAANAA